MLCQIYYHIAVSLSKKDLKDSLSVPHLRSNMRRLNCHQSNKNVLIHFSEKANMLTLDCLASMEISISYTYNIILGEKNCISCQYLLNRGLNFPFPSTWEIHFMQLSLGSIVLKQQTCQEWRQSQ